MVIAMSGPGSPPAPGRLILMVNFERERIMEQPKKTKYELRYCIGDGLAMRFAYYRNKKEAVEAAKFLSKKENDRRYYVKKVVEQIIFSVGNAIK